VPTLTHVPFGVGEREDYDLAAKALLGIVQAHGAAAMIVSEIDSVRDRRAWHLSFTINGGFLGWSLADQYDSWLDIDSLQSLRYIQDKHEGSYHAHHLYDIFPEHEQYSEDGEVLKSSVAHPLDEGSFLFFVRTMPLRIGLDTSFGDYFVPERNPVEIQVIRRDTVAVGGLTCVALLVHPVLNTSGMFSKGGDMQVWFSDDSNRIVLQIKANIPNIPVGRLSLSLKSYRLAGADSTRRTPACH